MLLDTRHLPWTSALSRISLNILKNIPVQNCMVLFYETVTNYLRLQKVVRENIIILLTHLLYAGPSCNGKQYLAICRTAGAGSHHKAQPRNVVRRTTVEPSSAFLPCDALRCTVFGIVILSVGPSVCPSVTLVDCVHMVRPTIMISSARGSPIILVSGDITFLPKFEGGHPERGR